MYLVVEYYNNNHNKTPINTKRMRVNITKKLFSMKMDDTKTRFDIKIFSEIPLIAIFNVHR